MSRVRNQKAKLAADYNDLLRELSSHEMTSIGLYSIGETIGQGTFGKVKLGTHKLTGQKVAIKKISKQHAAMVAREIHLQRQLKHAHIVSLYEIIVTESSIHVISEYCPRGELFEALTERGRCSERVAARWFKQIADAVRYCHAQHTIHRDLKLENILLDQHDNAKLCDFGFARQAQNRQMLDTFCGSLAYSAPEVILRQKYSGPETDVWSLGVILYTLLAGELPFDDDSEIVTQRKIVKGDYTLPPYFSDEAADLIGRMLKLSPSERVTIDQVMGHVWVRMPHEDNSEEDEGLSTPSRNSSHSDVDSIFSAQVQTPDMEHDDSCYAFPDKMSPQVRLSLGIHPTTTNRRSPRFSAPIVSHRPRPDPACRSSLPSVLPSHSRHDDPPMTPREQHLASALVTAGIDDSAVREMRNGTCDALNGLWNILLERPEKPNTAKLNPAAKQAPVPVQPPAKESVGVDAMTQTFQRASQPSSDKGWVSSVKSWFNTEKAETKRRSYRNIDAPLRGDQPRYWDTHLEAAPAYRPSSNQKHKRRVLQLSSPPVNGMDQLHYSSTTATPKSYRPVNRSSLATRTSVVKPPVAASAPVVTNTLSIVTTQAIPGLAREVDICEKRYSAMYPEIASDVISMPPMAASSAPMIQPCAPQCHPPASPVFSAPSASSDESSDDDDDDDPAWRALTLPPPPPPPPLEKRPPTAFDTRPAPNLTSRADFSPRARLSVYGMNCAPASRFASKAIIEEEEEEE